MYAIALYNAKNGQFLNKLRCITLWQIESLDKNDSER